MNFLIKNWFCKQSSSFFEPPFCLEKNQSMPLKKFNQLSDREIVLIKSALKPCFVTVKTPKFHILWSEEGYFDFSKVKLWSQFHILWSKIEYFGISALKPQWCRMKPQCDKRDATSIAVQVYLIIMSYQ